MLNREISMDLLTQLGEELFWKDMEQSEKYLEENQRVNKVLKDMEFSISKIKDLSLRVELEKQFGKLDEIFFNRQACVFDYVLFRAIALGYSVATFEKTLKDFLELGLY